MDNVERTIYTRFARVIGDTVEIYNKSCKIVVRHLYTCDYIKIRPTMQTFPTNGHHCWTRFTINTISFDELACDYETQNAKS